MIAARGFEATAVQDIASELGVTKQALLYYFKTKNALKLALIDALLEEADRRFRDIVTAVSLAASPKSRRVLALEHLERYVEESPDAAPVMLRFLLDRDAAAIERMQKSLRPWMVLVSEQIRKGQAVGIIRPELTAEMVFTQVGLLVTSHLSSLPLGDWGRKKSKRETNRQRLKQLLQTIGWVVFPDGKRPQLFAS
jgi:TetR/AcrR family transcriptional regulator